MLAHGCQIIATTTSGPEETGRSYAGDTTCGQVSGPYFKVSAELYTVPGGHIVIARHVLGFGIVEHLCAGATDVVSFCDTSAQSNSQDRLVPRSQDGPTMMNTYRTPFRTFPGHYLPLRFGPHALDKITEPFSTTSLFLDSMLVDVCEYT